MSKIIPLSLLLLLLFPHFINAQFSFGIQGGYVSDSGVEDEYALSRAWFPKSAGISNPMQFFSRGSGNSIAAIVTYEASPHIDLSLVYQTMHLAMKENQRSSSFNALGVQFKWNILKHSRTVVPFIQAGLMYSNSATIHQTTATSTAYPLQTQPAFDQTFASSLGFGVDVGLEVKLSQTLSVIAQVTSGGINFGLGDDTFSQSLNYGNYGSPSAFNPSVYYQASGGLKYYFNKTVKKRDF